VDHPGAARPGGPGSESGPHGLRGAGDAVSAPDAARHGANEGDAENEREGWDASIERLAGRLHTRVAHPTHAEALAVAVLRGGKPDPSAGRPRYRSA